MILNGSIRPSQEDIFTIQRFYEKVFGENTDNSKEFNTFVNGDFNPLRIKVEEWINYKLELHECDTIETMLRQLSTLGSLNSLYDELDSVITALELDSVIMRIIEEEEYDVKE